VGSPLRRRRDVVGAGADDDRSRRRSTGERGRRLRRRPAGGWHDRARRRDAGRLQRHAVGTGRPVARVRPAHRGDPARARLRLGSHRGFEGAWRDPVSGTTFLTGGTGIVGNAIAAELVRRGRKVRALVRSLERGRALLPVECELVQGDVTDAASVQSALDGCDVVYHSAGLPEQWLPDPGTFARVNVGGTRIVADAARAAGVARFMYTSTIDVFACIPGVPFDEGTIDPAPKLTAYERSKQDADRYVADL